MRLTARTPTKDTEDHEDVQRVEKLHVERLARYVDLLVRLLVELLRPRQQLQVRAKLLDGIHLSEAGRSEVERRKPSGTDRGKEGEKERGKERGKGGEKMQHSHTVLVGKLIKTLMGIGLPIHGMIDARRKQSRFPP